MKSNTAQALAMTCDEMLRALVCSPNPPDAARSPGFGHALHAYDQIHEWHTYLYQRTSATRLSTDAEHERQVTCYKPMYAPILRLIMAAHTVLKISHENSGSRQGTDAEDMRLLSVLCLLDCNCSSCCLLLLIGSTGSSNLPLVLLEACIHKSEGIGTSSGKGRKF